MPIAPTAVAQPFAAHSLAAYTRSGKTIEPELSGLPSHLTYVRPLGKGSYGSVYLCEDRSTGVKCAVKQIKDVGDRGKSSMRELMLLSHMCHENLIHLVDFAPVPSPDFKDVLFVLPYMPADLRKIIQSRQLTDKHVEVVVCQILRGLAFLHAAGVAHRDLKPANILLDAKVNVKICDFGLARGDMCEGEIYEGQSELTEYIVTRWYRAPEVMLLPGMYTSAIDIWSVGCILFEMLSSKPLFPGKNHLDMVRRFAEVCGKPPKEDIAWVPAGSQALKFLERCFHTAGKEEAQIDSLLSSSPKLAIDLVLALLSWDPSKRPSCTDAQEHPYLKHHLPNKRPPVPERFDWSFDSGKETSQRIRKQLYFESARLHPGILVRDLQRLQVMGWKCPEMSGERSRTPPPRSRKGSIDSYNALVASNTPRTPPKPTKPEHPRTRSTTGLRQVFQAPIAKGHFSQFQPPDRRKPGESSDEDRDARQKATKVVEQDARSGYGVNGRIRSTSSSDISALRRSRSSADCKRRF